MDQLEVLIHGSAEARRLSGEWAAEARRISEEGGDANLAIGPHEKHLVDVAFEDIREKFESGAAHKITGYTVRVPVIISAESRLGLHFGATAETALDLDKSKPGMPPFPCTQVQRVDDDGEIGRWNEQQRALAGADSPFSADENRLDDLTVIEPQQEPGNGASGRSVWLQAVEVHGQPGFTKIGEQGLKLLQEVRWRVGGPNAARARLILYFFIQASYCFRFKARDIHGHALHVLAVYDADGRRSSGNFAGPSASSPTAVLSGLLNYVNLSEECWFIAHNKMGTCEALHLAAGVGNVAFLDFLGEANADVDAKTRFDGKDNYTALHEAAFFKQTAAMLKLLTMRADVNSRNMKGQTPLHIAASQGGYIECRLLVKHRADVDVRDKAHFTALDSAMESGRYPPHKLFHLTGRGFSDLLKVALHSPSATTHLLKDVAENKIHDSWAEQLSKEMVTNPADGLQKWISLLSIAPRAGEEVIEALTIAPEVMDEGHHPLPRRVSMPEGTNFLCAYKAAAKWEYSGESCRGFPAWHDSLCPGCNQDRPAATASSSLPRKSRCRRMARQLYTVLTGQSRDPVNQVQSETPGEFSRGVSALPKAGAQALTDLVPAKVVMVKLPGLICPQVLYVLSTVKHPRIFVKIAVRAIVEFVWTNIVRYQYYWKTTQRATVLLLLFCFVAQWIPEDPVSLLRRGCWSLVAAQAYHELCYEVFEAVGFVIELKRPQEYFWKAKNFWDYISIGLGLALMHLSQEDLLLESWSTLLAVTVMGRWVMLTWTFRAFVWAGEKILPVLQASFVPMGGILLVTLFIFAGFWHSFAALTLAQGLLDQYQVLLATLRLLILGDGDGAAVVLGLYSGDEELGSHITFILWFIAVIAFCICLLNLFIAVHGEAYGKAQETAHISFLQERAAICLHCLLMPCWLPTGLQSQSSCPKTSAVFIYALTFAAWGVLVWFTPLHPWVAAGVLLVGSLVADLVLLQLPWRKQDSEKLFFWICHRDDYDDSSSLPAEVFDDIPGASAEQQEAVVRTSRLSMKLGNLKSSVEVQRFGIDLSGLEGRLSHLEKCVERATAAFAVLE